MTVTLKQLGPRKWHIDVAGRLPNGTDFRKRTTQDGLSRTGAMEWGNNIWKAAVDGTLKPPEPEHPGDQLVKDYAEEWLKTRTNRTAKDDKTRMVRHVLPAIGDKRMRDVTKQDIRLLFAGLKARLRSTTLDDLSEDERREVRINERREGKLSAATIRNTFSNVSVMFEQASADDLVPYTPVVLPPRFLPADDSDVTRPFTAHELATLFGCTAIPAGRRMLYALCFFTGTRIGEAVAIKRSNVTAMQPLDCFSANKAYSPKRKSVGPTKTGVSRMVPCHPILQEMLRLWLEHGFKSELGRKPQADDYICPREDGDCQRSVDVWKQLQADLAILGFGRRKVHALRTSFISLLRQAGVDKEIIRTMTHGRKASRDVIDRNYTVYDWPTLCESVLRMPIATPAGLIGTRLSGDSEPLQLSE